MKNIYTILLLITAQFSFAQNKSIQAKKLVHITYTKENAIQLVELLIKNYVKTHPGISNNQLTQIKKSIKYDLYLSDVETIFMNNYTETELAELVQRAQKIYPKQPIYKKVVEQQLYEAGKKFGKYVHELFK